jgi:fatty-acyl-CoA synthase
MKTIGKVNFVHLLKSSALRYPDKQAVLDADKNVGRTYRELMDRSNSLANGLLETGVKKGDLVAVLFRNCVEFVELYFALGSIGAVIAPQVNRLTPHEIKDLVNLSEARFFIFAQDFREVVDEIRPELSSVEVFVGLGDDPPEYAVSYERLATAYSTADPPVEVDEEDLQYLNYTSGTTDPPKSYLLNHYNNSVSGPMLFDIFEITSEDTILTVFPMYGRVGFGWSGMSAFKGARNVTLNFIPDRVLQVIQEQKVTIVNLVPIMAQLLWLYAKPEDYDLSSLRAIVFAGSSLPQTVLEESRKRLCPNIYEFYGLQETGIITSIDPETKSKKPASVGVPPVGVDMRLVDDGGNDVPRGEVGEVIMRGPAATIGYFKQPDKTAEVLRDGWFHTGDLGRLDEDGYLYVVGRNKDMIVTGAQNVFAPEVEETVLAHPAVADCAVIGLPHELWGEQVTAVIVLKEGESATEEEIIEHCKDKMAHFKAPKEVRFTDSLPRNLAMKVKKFVLVKEYSSPEE